MRSLADEYQCVLIDLPGFGESPPKRDMSMTKMAESVVEVLDELNIESCTMLGHSMGGYVALECLALYPEKIKALGLVHSTARSDSPEKIASRQKTIDFLDNGKLQDYARLFAPNLFAEQNRSNKEWITAAEKEVLKGSNAGLQEAMKAMQKRNDHSGLFSSLDKKFFFLSGRFDAMIPMEDMLFQASTCNWSMTRILDHTGHIGMVEEPDLTLQYIQAFLHWVYA